MAVSVVMPALEMAQETGKLVSWKKKEGENVAKGEMLLEVETDKAVVEIEAQAAGILGGVTAKIGDVVPVGHTIAWLLQPGEKPPADDGAHADGTNNGHGGARVNTSGGSRGSGDRRDRTDEGFAEGAQAGERARRGRQHCTRIGTGGRDRRRGCSGGGNRRTRARGRWVGARRRSCRDTDRLGRFC